MAMIQVSATRADIEELLQRCGYAATDRNVRCVADWVNRNAVAYAVAACNLPDKAVSEPLF